MSETRNSSLLGKITVLFVICCCSLLAEAKYGGGKGEPNDPYLIYTAEQMNAIGADANRLNDWDKCFKLMDDIDLSAYTGGEFNIIGSWEPWTNTNPFRGVFDGNGHTISNFTFSSTDRDSIGLFGCLDAEIKNLGLINPNVDAGTGFGVGLLVGYLRMESGTINNCYVQGGSVKGSSYVGGLVGFKAFGTINNCYATANVSGTGDYVSGLVGINNSGTINKCYATANVSGTGNYVSGLVGLNTGIINNCYSTGNVLGNDGVGGLVGQLSHNDTITNCYSTCSVSGDSNVGGLVGHIDHTGTITNCYSTGCVSGNENLGGLVGLNKNGTVSSSFWDTETSGKTTSAGGTGKTTAEMWIATTFTGWGCDPVWTIDDGSDYPRLWWENALGEPITIPSYGGGSGTAEDPYLIYTAEQMNEIGLSVNWDDWDKHFLLCADIDLSAFTGTSFNIIGTESRPFTGVFDGNGHTISNFTYTSAGTNYIGLFGYVSGPDVEIKDLGLIDPNVDAGAGRYVGSLVGRLRTGTITNCYVEGGSVAGDEEVGGLVGTNEGGTITNCYASGSVSGDDYVGGLVGFNHGSCSPGGCSSGMISNCYATSSVTGIDYVGGLVGGNYGTISNCYATGDVAGVDDGIGGLVGYNPYGTISDCYAKGSVKGDDFVGGLVGINSSSSSTMGIGTLNNCYSTGGVLGYANVGGLVGRNWVGGEIINCFWDIETSEQSTSAGGTGKTTAEMQTASTFALVVWGCGSVWTIDEGKDYPRLWWENAPGELITTPSYGGGSGEPNDPYLIYTAEQLNTIGLVPCHFDKHFKLMADIDLSNFTGTSFNIIGTYWAKPFTGVFDGNGHTISNFTYTSYYFIGLFGYVNDPNAEIKNLGLIDPNVDAWGDYVGSLIGQLSGGNISNCYVEGGSVSGNESGGLVGCVGDPFVYGYNDAAGTITNCYSTCSVSGNYCVGGLVGSNSGSVLNCYSTSSVTGKYDRVGGLVGTNEYGKITNCYSTGTVSGGDNVGGLVGLNTGHCVYGPKPPWPPRPDICYFGTISNCYSTGSVTGVWNVGGLVGENSWWDDWGYRREAEVWASFWDIETSGQDWSAGGTGKTTAEMQMEATFTDAGWDFVGETVNGIEDIWFIPQGDYPHLWWEGMQVPMKLTPRTLNCRSQGNWVKAHLTLPEGFTVADVDSDRPAVLHSFGFESAPLYVFVNKNELVEIEAAFEREVVCSLAGDWPQALTVAGFLADGNIFLGRSTVRIIHPGMKVIEELAWYWLNADCVHPDFCDGIDMNRDSLVNLLDYALLMNIEVEFVTDE